MATSLKYNTLKHAILLFLVIAAPAASLCWAGEPPTAHAGPSRYAASNPITLDGSASYDPENADLSYLWQQTAGPAVTLENAHTATPTLSGFTPGPDARTCRFQLVVNDGTHDSVPAVVDVVLVPDFGENTLELRNPPFDPNRPTILGFNGGNCVCGNAMDFIQPEGWFQNVNLLTTDFCPPYTAYGDMLVAYLSEKAPGYMEPIQTIGFSTGGNAAIISANHINQTYQDPRYAINRVTLLDAGCDNIHYPSEVEAFHDNPVGGEPAWVDNYRTSSPNHQGTLNLIMGGDHQTSFMWFINSSVPGNWPGNDMYNNGITAGYYVSVAGPGRYLDLVTDRTRYSFSRDSDSPGIGYLGLTNRDEFPGQLPEPPALVGPADGAALDPAGTVFSCEPSENAVEYERLVGTNRGNPDISLGTSTEPPTGVVTGLPSPPFYWTVKARDAHGTTVFSRPRLMLPAEAPGPLTVAISSPANGAQVTGTVNIAVQAATAAGNAQITGVSFFIDGQEVHAATSPPWEYSWDTMTETNRYHTLKAVATDSAGNRKETSSWVWVRNMTLQLQAERKEDRAWMIRSRFTEITVDITLGNASQVPPVQTYRIYKKSIGAAYRVLRDASPPEVQNNRITVTDNDIEEGEVYIYKAVALDASGRVLAESQPVTG